MIKELYLYFAQYPKKSGVLTMATMGESGMEDYAAVLQSLNTLPAVGRVNDIDHYVYGQTFDEVRQRVDRLQGIFLFADYGEFSMRGDGRRSFQVEERIAVTVAEKLSDRADQLERILASNKTLRLLCNIHAWIIADSEAGTFPWMNRDNIDRAEIVPFVSPELHSFGWTLMFNAQAADMLGVHALSKQL